MLHLLQMFLKVYDSLQSLPSAVTDGIALFTSAKRPRSFRSVPIRALVVERVALNLATVQPFQRFKRMGFGVLFKGQAGLNQSLRHKRGVPELAAVGPAHHHSLRANPHEVSPFERMLLPSIRSHAFRMCTTDKVHHFTDWSKRLVGSVLVLLHY